MWPLIRGPRERAASSVRLDGEEDLQMLAPGHERDIDAGRGQIGAEVSSDGAGAHHRDSHGAFLPAI